MHFCLNKIHLGIPAERKTRKQGGQGKLRRKKAEGTGDRAPHPARRTLQTAVIGISPQRMLGNAAARGKGRGGKQRSALGHKRREHTGQGGWKSGERERRP